MYIKWIPQFKTPHKLSSLEVICNHLEENQDTFTATRPGQWNCSVKESSDPTIHSELELEQLSNCSTSQSLFFKELYED